MSSPTEPTRTCGFCGEGELHRTGEIAMRGGGRQETWTCRECGLSVKLLDPWARIVFGVLTAGSLAVVPYAAVTERVARESERPWIVALLASFAIAMAVLFVRDLRAQRRHPPR